MRWQCIWRGVVQDGLSVLAYRIRVLPRSGSKSSPIASIVRHELARVGQRLESNLRSAVGKGGVVVSGLVEEDALAIIAFARSFALDAVLAHRLLFAALDAALSTSQATRLGPLARQSGL